ncbi:MAG TPA: PHB depolymerase family esterase [Longimicrobium sp.]|jgi:predicted esterase
MRPRLAWGKGRLHARPAKVPGAGRAGLYPLGLDAARDSYLYVPESHWPEQPMPLVLMLHGAGGHAHHGLGMLRHLADAYEFIVLAPASRGRTWDMLLDGYGADVALIDRALAVTFERYAVDPRRLAIGGFSDGASYALSLGVGNGDLFSHVLAFSPGFMEPDGQQGAPAVFVSHGTGDRVLPIGTCSRRVVPALRQAGYGVRYREFAGGHTVPPEIAREAVQWFTLEGDGQG